MKILVDQEVLAKALSFISRIVVNRPSYPILSNLLMDASKSGSLSISSTNLDITLTVQCGADVKEAGKITAPAKTLHDFVSFLDQGPIDLETDKDKLTVSSTSHNAVFSTIPTEEFPELPEVADEKSPLIVIPGKLFKATVDKLAFACAKDPSRPMFSAVLIEQAGDSLIFVGLDGHRLSKINVDVKPLEKLEKLFIPADAMEEVARGVADEDDVSIYLVKKGQHVVIKYGTITLAARQVEGVYPDYKMALPKEELTKVIVSTEELLNSVKIARLFSSDQTANRVEMVYKDKTLTVSASGSGVGENTTTIEVEGEGDDFNAAFNAQFLSDVLSRIDTELTELSTFAPATDEKLRGGVFREKGNEDFVHLVMPLFKV